MSIEIKTSSLKPVRNTYEHIKRRFGDKPATRYQEASYDVAPVTNFHYKPLWEPDKEINDPTRTALQMEDWYVFRDPRQYYYGTYVQARARLQEVTESNYKFFEKRDYAASLSREVREKITQHYLPLRHLELGANMNNMFCTAHATGTVLAQGFIYNSMDRLGIAQYISRIGLLLDDNSGDSLAVAKNHWMTDPAWQGARRYTENVMVLKDWFEVFIAQDVVLDTLIYHLYYECFDKLLDESNASQMAILTEFMQLWYKDNCRWVAAVLKTAVTESETNRELIQGWVAAWRERAIADISPLADVAVGSDVMAQCIKQLDEVLNKAGL